MIDRLDVTKQEAVKYTAAGSVVLVALVLVITEIVWGLGAVFRELVVALYNFLTLRNIAYILAVTVGIGFVPFLIFFRLLPGGLKRVVARIMWTIGALSLGGDAYVLDQRETGRYEANPVEKDDDTYYVIRDGERYELDGDPDTWSRLGWRRFAITYEKTPEVFAPLAPDDLPEDAHADGGVILTGVERGGYPEAVIPSDDEGFTVSMSRVDSLMEGAGGPETAFVAGWQALKKEGGDSAGMSNIALAISTLLALVMGASMAMFL